MKYIYLKFLLPVLLSAACLHASWTWNLIADEDVSPAYWWDQYALWVPGDPDKAGVEVVFTSQVGAKSLVAEAWYFDTTFSTVVIVDSYTGNSSNSTMNTGIVDSFHSDYVMAYVDNTTNGRWGATEAYW